MSIDFELSTEQQDLRALAKKFAQDRVRPIAADLDALANPAEAFKGTVDIYREACGLGFTKALIPREYGGLGLSSLDFSLIVEELSRADDSIADTILVTMLCLKPVMYCGTARQREMYLTQLTGDSGGDFIAAFAASEPEGTANFDASQDGSAIRTTATHKDGTFVLNGTKAWVTNAPGLNGSGPSLFAVLARVVDETGRASGSAVFMVPGDAPGITIAEPEDKVGGRLCVQAEVTFSKVVVHEDAMIGEPGQGLQMQVRSFAWLGAIMSAACVGLMEEAYDYVLEFARSYTAAGSRPILHIPTVGYALSDAKMYIEAARYLGWRACAANDKSGDQAKEISALAKIFCSETAVKVTTDLMATMGVHSSSREHPIGKCVRDSLLFPVRQGSNQGIQRKLVHQVLLTPGYESTDIAYS